MVGHENKLYSKSEKYYMPPPKYHFYSFEDYEKKIVNSKKIRTISIIETSIQKSINNISSFPINLVEFSIINVKIGNHKLPEFPKSLKKLECINNQLFTIPKLPNGFIILICMNNLIEELPELPDSLEFINCAKNNYLTILPEKLPSKLSKLLCNDCKLKKLPELPESLDVIECQNNQLTYLPESVKDVIIPYFENNYDVMVDGNNRLQPIPKNHNSIIIRCYNNYFDNDYNIINKEYNYLRKIIYS